MKVHMVLLALVAGILISWKAGWLHLEVLEEKKGRRLFVIVALTGNLLGFLVTYESGSSVVFSDGHRMEKSSEESYEERFLVSIEGEETESILIQVPEKENGEDRQDSGESAADEGTMEQRLTDAVALYNEEKNDPDYYYLPSQWEGKHLEWQLPGDHSGNLLAALSLFAGFALLLRQAQEDQEFRKKKTEQLLMDYPGLVMKFTLLVQAGMTVRKAFQKIALDYQRKSTGGKRFAYEEIMIACREMDSGISEAEAYRRFGERCGQIKYKTFSVLLIQNLQKGSRHMAELLEKESMEAWDERKRKARVLGESAATKLLVPMLLMMAVVMAIIMVPAFLAFYG